MIDIAICTLHSSSTPAWYSFEAAVALNEWFVLYPVIPAFEHKWLYSIGQLIMAVVRFCKP